MYVTWESNECGDTKSMHVGRGRWIRQGERVRLDINIHTFIRQNKYLHLRSDLESSLLSPSLLSGKSVVLKYIIDQIILTYQVFQAENFNHNKIGSFQLQIAHNPTLLSSVNPSRRLNKPHLTFSSLLILIRIFKDDKVVSKNRMKFRGYERYATTKNSKTSQKTNLVADCLKHYKTHIRSI